ncbi:TPA: acyltransferase [Citrobacter freundii]|uniref:acyltransferase family protein n=1 Tax=Citrobacter freundii TaxID=546 RepID=UPI0015EA8862|nr:acyltransferase [Citrobacter freundii]EKX7350230.1 acyltransferase [Citrobacter freundii]QLS14863.1 acyltransferase [Citrobacter freundii]WIJ92458.1 acyltransferase [Citrobacter freundii]HCL5682700.1 acyltransferase [Citrobacter freundii]HCL6564530.1 acyltransferase [Citrobacter freundii]
MNIRDDLHGLTIFRFLTAFYVFLFHCNLRYKADVPEWLQSIIGNGAVGMSFFFVLSGFVLAWASRNGIKENYYRSRVARIFPAYLAMGLLTAPFLLEYKATHSIVYVLLFATTSQSWFPDSFNQWHFGGSWSISTEMFFYLTFPLIFPLIKKRPIVALCIAILASSVIIPISILLTGSAMFPYYYVSPIHRLPEFVAGVAAGCIFTQGFRFSRFNSALFITAILLLLFISPYNNTAWMNRNYVTVPATCFIVYYLASSTININKITQPFIYLGKISYSFYLMQIPIMIYISKNNDMLANLPVWFIWTVLAIINLIMASACYHFIEDNKTIKSTILKWKNKTIPSLDVSRRL